MRPQRIYAENIDNSSLCRPGSQQASTNTGEICDLVFALGLNDPQQSRVVLAPSPRQVPEKVPHITLPQPRKLPQRAHNDMHGPRS